MRHRLTVAFLSIGLVWGGRAVATPTVPDPPSSAVSAAPSSAVSAAPSSAVSAAPSAALVVPGAASAGPPGTPVGAGTVAPPDSRTANKGAGRSEAGALAALARPGRRFLTVDANLDGGYGRLSVDGGRNSGLFRARLGALVVREPNYYAVGPTFVAQEFAPLAVGLQFEALTTEAGVWAQLEGLVDFRGKLGATLSAGWSLFGAEFQFRHFDSGAGTALFGKVRIPLSIIAIAVFR